MHSPTMSYRALTFCSVFLLNENEPTLVHHSKELLHLEVILR